MEDEQQQQTRRVTIRLTPYQARRLWQLRSSDLPEGARPRTVTEVLIRALVGATRSPEQRGPRGEPGPAPAPTNGYRADGSFRPEGNDGQAGREATG